MANTELFRNNFKYYSVDVNSLNYNNEPLFFSAILNFNFKLFSILKTRTINLKKKIKQEIILFLG